MTSEEQENYESICARIVQRIFQEGFAQRVVKQVNDELEERGLDLRVCSVKATFKAKIREK